MDFDGVIGDTAHMNYGIVLQLHPGVTEQQFIDHHLGNVYKTPVIPFTKDSSERYFELYNQTLAVEHVATAVPYIKDLARQYTLHIVTSNCEHAVRRVLQEAGIAVCFGLMLGREAHESKSEKFIHLFQSEDFSAAESVYITDTQGDLKEAAAVGLQTIAVTFGYHPRELLLAGTPTVVADSWPEVVDSIHDVLHTT